MAYNASSTIAGLRTVLTRLLELPAGYLTDSARHRWTTMLRQLPPLAFRSFHGHPTIAPAQVWERVNNQECPQLYPVFPWGIYGIGRPGLDTAIKGYNTAVGSFEGTLLPGARKLAELGAKGTKELTPPPQVDSAAREVAKRT